MADDRSSAVPDLFRAVFGGSFWILLDRFGRIAIGLFITAWVARYLGPDSYGALTYGTAVIGVFGAAASLGISSIVIRDLSSGDKDPGRVLVVAFLLKLVGSLASAGLAAGAIFLIRDDEVVRAIVLVLSMTLVLNSLDVVDMLYQSRLLFKPLAIVKFAAFLIGASVRVGLVLSEAPVLAFAWAGLLEAGLVSAGYLVLLKRARGIDRVRPEGFDAAVALLRQGLPLLLTGVAVMVQARVDQLMLGAIRGNAEMGQYAVALRIIEVMAVIPVAIHSVTAPLLYAAKSRSRPDFLGELAKVYRLSSVIGIAMVIPGLLLGPYAIGLLFGEQYSLSSTLFLIMLARLYLACLGIARATVLTAEGRLWYAFATTALGAGLNAGLNWLLLPVYGAAGAATIANVSFLMTIVVFDLSVPTMRWHGRLMLLAAATPWRIVADMRDSRRPREGLAQ